MPSAYSRNENPSHRVQGYILAGLVTAIFLILIGRLYYFQVISGEIYQAHSERNSIRPVTVEAPRGLILDRHGIVLADNRASYTIAAIPIEISDATIDYLAELTGRDARVLRKKIRDRSLNRFKPLPIQRDASFETVSRVEEHLIDLPGVTVQIEPTRLYTKGGIGGHLLGYVSEVNKAQLVDLKEVGYQSGDLIGKSGVEKAFERFLRGQNGLEYIEVNARGQELGPLEGMSPVLPIPGQNVYLTIDALVQEVADRAIPDSLAGALVAVDPMNGEVLAYVSKPNYDPNLFPTGIPTDIWNAIRDHPLHPLLNRVANGLYPSASTMKIVTAAAGLEVKFIEPLELMQPCVGGFKLGTRWAKCWHSGHGKLSLVDAISNSCDVYFYQLGLRLGLERWGEYARGFGLGSPTGIDIGDEHGGLIPDMTYYDAEKNRAWTPGKMLNLAIGQGELLVTPLQMAVLTAAVANGGTLYRPHVLHEVTSPQGDQVVQGGESIKGQLPIRPETLQLLQEAMIAVVNRGTGARVRLGYTQVAGKTGTAENPHGEDHSWFIGYAPAGQPRIAVAAIIENAPHGMAVPIVRQVIDAYLSPGRTPPSVSLRSIRDNQP